MNHQRYTVALLARRDQVPDGARTHFLPSFFQRSRNPTVIFGLSLWLGFLGIDRFVVGDWGKGVLKLLTVGGFGIWMVVDWFLITARARAKNLAVADIMLAELNGAGDEPA